MGYWIHENSAMLVPGFLLYSLASAIISRFSPSSLASAFSIAFSFIIIIGVKFA